MEYGKVQQKINDVVGDNVKKLAQLFPAAVKDGEVDFEALKEELGQFKEVDSEKYELTWAGKKNAKKIAQEDIVGKTLKFIPEDSKNADTTENLYIEGDNLEVLKLLRQNYYGAVKMIYIDPPYNTGNDFVYNDFFEMSKEESDLLEGETDITGKRYTMNSKSHNKYHANWINMMYPRLRIAKDLLTDDGVMLVSIDDNELCNIIKVGKEIFGDDNCIATLIWKSRQNKDNRNLSGISVDHEYVVIFVKNINLRFFKGEERRTDNYKNPDNDPRGAWTSANMAGLLSEEQRPNCHYDLINPSTGINYGKPKMGWRYDKSTMARLIDEDRIIWPDSSDGRPRRKVFLNELTDRLPGFSSLIGSDIYTRNGTVETEELMGSRLFEFPKPSDLIVDLVLQTSFEDSTVMDFFSGSGTFAHAVMKANVKDGGTRKFILVQLPEYLSKNSEAGKRGYHTICDLAIKRINVSGERLKDKEIDTGFKVFRIADTNIKWNSLLNIGQLDLNQIENNPDMVDFFPNAKDVDIVYELMLRQKDVPLSSKIEHIFTGGGYQRTYLYAHSYLVCLETKITEELIDKLAGIDPLPIKFIFRDSAFQDNIALKDETFRRLKALIEKNNGMNKIAYTVEFI